MHQDALQTMLWVSHVAQTVRQTGGHITCFRLSLHSRGRTVMLSKPDAQVAVHRHRQLRRHTANTKAQSWACQRVEHAIHACVILEITSALSGLIAMLGGQVWPAPHVMRLMLIQKSATTCCCCFPSNMLACCCKMQAHARGQLLHKTQQPSEKDDDGDDRLPLGEIVCKGHHTHAL